jgi:TP901 family phage tail tape measure protein
VEDYRLLVGTKIDTKGIQGQLNLIKNKYITVNVKINEVGIQNQLTKLQKKYITADVKLNKQGLQKQLNEISSDKTIKLKTEIDKSKGLGNLNNDTTNLNKSTKTLQKNLDGVGTKLNGVNKHSQVTLSRFGDMIKKVTAFGLATSVIGSFTTGMYQAVESVKEMDASLTELKKVSDLSGDGLKQYTEDAFVMARDLMTTASNVVDATALFTQAGYNLDESKTLSKYAIMMQTISDNSMEVADASSFLTSTMKAFNMTAKDSEMIISAVNETSNKYAITSNDLTDNLGKISSVASIAGVSFQELIGLMVSSVEKTRNASKSANAFKSIFINLQQMSDDGTVPKLEEQFKAFGLSMVDNNGAIKSAYDLLKELSGVYKEVSNSTDVDKQNKMRTLLEDIGGKYNYNVLVSSLSGFNTAISATETALNSAGSAQEEFEKAQDSIAKKIEALQGAFQELMYGDGGLSDFIKQILDLGTKILQFADSPMGKFVITMGEVLVAMKAFKMLMGSGLVTDILKFSTVLSKDGVGALKKYNQELINAKASTEALSKGAKLLSGLKSFGMGLAITAGMEIVSKGMELLDELKTEKYNEAIASYEKATTNIDKLEGEIDNLKVLHEKLKEAGTEKTKLAGLYSELNKQVGASIGLLDGETTAIDVVNKKIQDQIDLKQQQIDKQNEIKKQSSISAYENYDFNTEGFMHEAEGAKYSDLYGKSEATGVFFGGLSKDELESGYNELLKQAKVFTKEIVENSKVPLFNEGYIDKFLESMVKSKRSPQAIQDELSNMLSDVDLQKVYDEFYKSIESGEGDTSALYKSLVEKLNEYTKYGTVELRDYTTDFINKLTDTLNSASSKIANKMIEPLEEVSISSIIDDVADQFDALSKAQEEMSDSGVLSGSTIKSLISSFPEVEDALVATANGYTINKEKLDELNDSLLYKYELAKTTAIKEANEIVNAQNTESQAYASTTAEVKKLLQAKMALLTADISQQQQLSVSNQVTDGKFSNILGNKLGGGTGVIAKNIAGENAKALQNQLKQLQQALANIDTAEKTYDKAQTAISSLGSASSKSSSSSSSSSSTEDVWKKSFDEKQATLKYNLDMNYITEKQYYDDLAYLNDVYFKGRNEYLDEYRDNLVEVYQGQKKLQEDAIDDIETLRDMIVDMLKSQTEEKIKSLESERDKLDEIYDLRKKALEVLKEENEYQEQLAESNKTVADIESELQAVKLDTSREGVAKRLQLEEELAKATEDRDKLVKDKQYENSLEAIDKEKEASDKYFEDKISQLQLYLDNQGLLIDDANARMRNANADLYNQLLAWNKIYGDGITSTISNAWNSALNALNNYKAQANQVLGSSYSVGSTYTPTMSSSATQYYQQQAQSQYDDYVVKKGDTLWALAQKYYGSGTKWSKIQSANGGVDPYNLRIGSTLKIPKYAKGTLGVGENQIARINELGDELVVRANGQGDFTSLTKGSGVIPSNLTKNLMEWGKMNPNMFSQLSNNDNSSISIGDIIINGSSSLTRDDLDIFRKSIVTSVMDNIQHNKSKIGVKNNVFNLS